MSVPMVLTESVANLIGWFADAVETRSCHVTSRQELVAIDVVRRQEELYSIEMWVAAVVMNA